MRINETQREFSHADLKVYYFKLDADPFRVSGREMADRFGFEYQTMCTLMTKRIRHLKGSFGKRISMPIRKTAGRPVEDMLLNSRQLRDVLPDLVGVAKSNRVMGVVDRSVHHAKCIIQTAHEPEYAAEVKARVIAYLAKPGALSQQKLADLFGCSGSTLSRWLRGCYFALKSKRLNIVIQNAGNLLDELEKSLD